MKPIILASASPRRKMLLEKLGLKFTIEPSNYFEDMTLNLSPVNLVKKLALEKAKDVAKNHFDSIIISADTIVVLGNKVYGKPLDRQDAIRILSELNNHHHSVITSFTIIDTSNQKIISLTDESIVIFKNNSLSEIKKYIDTDKPYDKAGAYAIQDPHMNLINKIEGDVDSIVGLPITKLAKSLKDFGIICNQ